MITLERRRHVARAIGMATVAGIVAANAAIVTTAFIAHWRTEHRDALVSGLRARLPWIDTVVWHADARWVPLPFEKTFTELELLERMDAALDWQQQQQELPRGDSPDALTRFMTYLEGWSAQSRLCEALGTQFPRTAERLCLDHAEQLDRDWSRLFRERFAGQWFIKTEGVDPVVGRRNYRSSLVCNLTPVNVRYARVEYLASDEVAGYYDRVFGERVDTLRQHSWSHLAPGACEEGLLHGYDVMPDMLVYSEPDDPVFESWFTKVWTRHYAPELGTMKVRQALAEQHAQMVGGEFCTAPAASVRAAYAHVACTGSETLKPYVAGFNRADTNGLFFAIAYPTISSYEAVLSDDQRRLDLARLNQLRESVAELHGIAKRYYALSMAWKKWLPRYELGARLVDANGPFAPGVEAASIPDTTILSERVIVPRSGTIVAVNDGPVYSDLDIRDQLHRHGNSRQAGIMKYLRLAIAREAGDVYEYKTRYRFIPGTTQLFDQDVGVWEGLKEGFTFNSESLQCAIGSIFSEVGDHDECVWMNQQRNAYARQVAPSAFAFGEIASALVPVGPAIVKSLRSTRRAGKLRKMAVSGAIEAAWSGAYAYTAAPPAVPVDLRLEQAKTGVGYGFVFGSFMMLR